MGHIIIDIILAIPYLFTIGLGVWVILKAKNWKNCNE